MSIRTLIEINHDYGVRDQDALLPALQRYLNSGSREAAQELEHFGLRVIGLRHHSSPYILDGTPDGFPVQYLVKPKTDA